MRNALTFIAALLAVSLIATGAEAKRVALTIGNDEYDHLPVLRKTVADARTYAEVLKVEGLDEAMLKTDALVSAAPPINECDRLAAIMLDLDKPPTIGGRFVRKDRAPHAIEACRSAVNAHPEVPRYKTQLAYALTSAQQLEEARRLFEEAAVAGHAAAMRSIGVGRLYGLWYPKGEAEGVRWLEKAVAAGDAVAYRILAAATYLGTGVVKNPEKAVSLLRQSLPILERAAAAGDPDAPSELAMIYFDNLAFPGDAEKAAEYLAEGFSRGSRDAATVFSIFWRDLPERDRIRVEQILAAAGFSPGPIDGTIDKQTLAALQEWVGAVPAASLPSAPGQPAKGAALVTDCDQFGAIILDPDKPAGFHGFDRPARSGDERIAACRKAVADHPDVRRFKTELAFALLAGDGASEAAQLFKAAAEAGHSPAMFGLAAAYLHGAGVKQDATEGVRWLEKSISAGYALGLIGKAYFYKTGTDGLEKDAAKSEEAIAAGLPLLERAAANGDPDAPAVLAQLYIEGTVVPLDVDKAAPLFLEGLRRRSDVAANALRNNTSGLSLETRTAAEQILADAGHSPGPVDGVIDDQTKAALQAYVKEGNDTAEPVDAR